MSRKLLEQKDRRDKEPHPTTAFETLRKEILSKHPELGKESPEQARREFERITKKMRRHLPFKTWQEMDRFAKGDRYGFAR
ncbi:MAG: hypothetical protein Q7J56_03055 [Deltaproteobacteria bacterium]|nr:hypothetical protein [Deltaproteobacteria bacterium]